VPESPKKIIVIILIINPKNSQKNSNTRTKNGLQDFDAYATKII
jgi:hypothetical protein